MSPSETIVEFVLDRLEGETLAKRVAMKRALAQIVANNARRHWLNAMADELEAYERRHQQGLLDFKRGAL